MIARSRAAIGPDGRLADLSCQPPLTVRQVIAAEPGTCALCLVGSAAGPLPGDDLALTVEVAPGARATLQAAGASIAQGRGGPAAAAAAAGGFARLGLTAVIGAGASLRADPGPLVVRAGGRVRATVRIALAAGAAVDWRDLVVLAGGPPRSGPAGFPAAVLSWDVTCAGRPLLRQAADLTDPAWPGWPELLGGGRILASALLAGPGVAARTVVAGPAAVAQRLAGGAVLVTVLGDDAATTVRQRDALCAEVLRAEVAGEEAPGGHGTAGNSVGSQSGAACDRLS